MKSMSVDERIQLYKKFVNENNAPFLAVPAVMQSLLNMGFFTAPASTKYHGNYEGGLFDHSLNVAKKLVELTKELDLRWCRWISPIVVGLFHDLCKCNQYELLDGQYQHKDTLIGGHGTKSVIRCAELLTLTQEEILCITFHMGAFTEKEEWKNYTGAIHHTENVLWTHVADMYATHVIEVNDND